MTLSDRAQQDLHRTATQRVEKAVNSVAQLLEDDGQVAHLLLVILAQLAITAAEHMHNTVTKPDGSQPTETECFCRVLSMIAATQDMESRIMTEADAKKLGLQK